MTMTTARLFASVSTCWLVLASFMVLPAPALAQRDAGAKARGDFTFYARSGGSHMNAAHAHASHYYGYLGGTHTVSPRVVRMAGSTINHHLDLTEQHLDGMREYFVSTDDAASIAAIDATRQHLADAKHYHALAESTARRSPQDIASIRGHVDQVRTSLDKATTSYGELLTTHGLADEQIVKPSPQSAPATN
jgi:hypothetical protein